jgi:hypothetical protein
MEEMGKFLVIRIKSVLQENRVPLEAVILGCGLQNIRRWAQTDTFFSTENSTQ